MDEIPLPAGPGRLWLCGKHFVAPDAERALRSVGGDVIVCLCEEHELADRYPAYVRWLRGQPPDRALWWPVPDLHAPAIGDARALVRALTDLLAGGAGLLVHCGAGIGRAGTVAAALLIHMGLSHTEAVAVVAASRPMAGPEAGAQTELLAAFAGED